MKRRECITLIGGALAAWPLSARAQQRPIVGFLHYASPKTLGHLAEAVRRGMQEVGYVEGQNLMIEYRWAEGHYDRLPALADDLVHRQVDIMAAATRRRRLQGKRVQSFLLSSPAERTQSKRSRGEPQSAGRKSNRGHQHRGRDCGEAA